MTSEFERQYARAWVLIGSIVVVVVVALLGGLGWLVWWLLSLAGAP